MTRQFRMFRRHVRQAGQNRKGGFMVLAAFCLVAALGFVSLCVDVGYLSLTKQRMQNGVDAAALAAAMEITNAVQTAGPNVTNVTAYAEQQARLKAKSVAALNGIYIDSDRDVQFGQRILNDNNGNTTTTWNVSPPNVVKVTAHRDNADAAASDSKLRLFFAGVLGNKTASLVTSAAAYVESRDIVAVLDFSGSMNDDSTYSTLGSRDRASLENNMQEIYNILAGLRNLGGLQFEPQWLVQTASAGAATGNATFKNTTVDVTTTKTMTSVKLTFSDSSTQTLSASGTSGTFTRSGSAKSIDKVQATVQYEDWGTVQSDSATSSSKTATVTFNNSNISVSTTNNMSQVKLFYSPSGSSTFSASGKSNSATGTGSYVSSVQVTMGSTTVTVNNPNGSSPSTVSQTLTFNDTTANVKTYFSLNGSWPWTSGSWSSFVDYCRSDSQISNAGYTRKYGGKCLVNYLLTQLPAFSQCADLWRTPHYPFHSLKQGAMLLTTFLDDLNFGDELGFVSYDTNYRVEDSLNYDGYSINISSNPICDRFTDLSQIIRHKQAAHYFPNTNIGGGIHQGKLLLDSSKRAGTRPTLLLMTDGLANIKDSSYHLPSDWNWNDQFDYDGDGHADYTTSDSYRQYALGMAKEAVDAGYTIHTLTVGLGADTDLMDAIAWMGRGIAIHVPGNLSVAEMQDEVLEAFNRIAAFVPPAKLVPTE